MHQHKAGTARPDVSFPGMLHLDEKVALWNLAAELPPGGRIVEVGTSSGWTARMLARAASGCEVRSLDIRDKRDPGADQELPDNVRYLLLSSPQYAAAHAGERTDLLFIDGSHTTLWAFLDFLCLSEQMPDGASVAFHDYAPRFPQLLLVCDALRESGRLRDRGVADTLFFGRLDRSAPLPDAEVFGRIAARHRACHEAHLDGFARRGEAGMELLRSGRMRIVGRGKRGRCLARLADVDEAALLDSDQAREDGTLYCICSWYDEEIYQTLMARGVAPERVHPSRELMWFGFWRDLLAGGQVLRGYFEAQAGVAVDPRLYGPVLGMGERDLLWLCWLGYLFEL